MDLRFHAGGEDNWSADVALVPVLKGERILETCPELCEAAPFLQIAPGMRDLRGERGEIHLVYGHPDLPYSRVMFLGLGEPSRDELLDALRRAYAAGVRRARAMGLHSAHIPFYSLARFGESLPLLEEAVYACALGGHDHGAHRKRSLKSLPPRLEILAVGFRDEYVPDEARLAARRGERAAGAVLLARELAMAPANERYPESFAERAAEIARQGGFSCEIFDERALEDMGFGAHLAVGAGGAHAPRLVVLDYAPEGKEDEDPLLLVGKGITFDSGGISLKPSAKMHLMKTDMTGAACVLAAMAALAEEEVPSRVVGLMPLAENMPDGGASRPGDVVTGRSGDTIEIVNTDAEGRLVLCDALAYAGERWKARATVDVATLTGACAVALGDGLAGLFSNDDGLAEAVAAAGARGGERYWRLPLWKAYREKLKSPLADICHTSSSREGGAITAALFLEHFVKEGSPWAHLDIAGVDWAEKGGPLCPEGATGFAARTLLELGRGGLR